MAVDELTNLPVFAVKLTGKLPVNGSCLYNSSYMI